MGSSWKILPLDSSSDVPIPLLVKYEITPSSYAVWITDLSGCWAENADRRQIIRRAFDLETSIDPSEDPDQLRLFLRYLGEGFDSESSATLKLQQHGEQGMILAMKLPLPGSLAPFEWNFHLNRSPSTILVTQLLFPIFNSRLADSFGIASLLQEIENKDNMISKLTETMQSGGISMSKVFPGVKSLKSVSQPLSRDALGKSVKSLSRFDASKWQDEQDRLISQAAVSNDLIARLFQQDPSRNAPQEPFVEFADWARLVKGKTRSPLPGNSAESKIKDRPECEETEEFQRQKTPPSLHQNTSSEAGEKSPTPRNIESPPAASMDASDPDASTTDESADEQSTITKPSHEQLLLDGSPRGAQSIVVRGGQGQEIRLPSHYIQGEETLQQSQPNEKPHDSPDVPASSPKRGRVGRIGGKRLSPNLSASNEGGAKNGSLGMHSQSAPKNLGKDQNQASGGLQIESDRQAASSTENVREDPQERANKKREALKRELEIKSQSGGKKKRRF